MTRTFARLAALAIVCVAAPAFAHGGHGGAHNDSMPPSTQHMQSSQTTNGTNHGVNPKNSAKISARIIAQSIALDHKLGALANQLVADVQAGNKGAVRRLVREIRQDIRLLGHLQANPNTTLALLIGANHTVILSAGGVTIDGKPV